MARTKKIKVFEAFIGNEWKSWSASGDATINKTGKVVTIVNKVKSDTFVGVLTTQFDLSKIVAHSIGT